MKKLTKKEIKHTVKEAIGTALEKLSVSSPSKKTKKILAKASKDVSRRLKVEVKHLNKKMKTTKASSNKKAKKELEVAAA